MKFKLKKNKYLWQTSSNRVENRVKNQVYNRNWIFIAPLETRSGHGAEKNNPLPVGAKIKAKKTCPIAN